MPDAPRRVQHDVELLGCTPEPLMSYLKALGILRLVSEQVDSNARGWWKNDVFVLRSSLDGEALVEFFLDNYKPTPILAPWAGGSGFFGKDNRKFVDAIAASSNDRYRLYRECISDVRAILAVHGVTEKPTEDVKARLIAQYRHSLPDQFVAWMDAVMVIQVDGQTFAPLLGTGGNDGRLDFTQNFMGRIVEVGILDPATRAAFSTEWLRNSLFADVARLRSASVGQFSPGRVGGPNATQGMEGDATDNPWDFMLMIEGTLMLAGATSKRLGSTSSASTTFPFTVRPIAAGFSSPSVKDESASRGELWLPIWDRMMSVSELRQLFGEGRAELSHRPARDGADFARAVAALGIDRGVTAFTRTGFLKRSGLSYLAAPLGRFSVEERREVDLLQDIDGWLSNFRRACVAKDAPARLDSALRPIDSAIFDFCHHGGVRQFQRILIALGSVEQQLGRVERFRDKHKITPITGLSQEWIAASNDNSPEFLLALALASIHDPEGKVGPLRANLEAVDWSKNRCKAWAERDRSVVWTATDLSTNLANVLQRRMMDGDQRGCVALPLASRIFAPLEAITALIAGELNEEKVEQLLWGIMLVAPSAASRVSFWHEGITAGPLPREYALLRLLFLASPMPSVRGGEQPVIIRPEPRILPLLRAGRIDEACRIAAQRLRVSGLAPIPLTLRTGIVRDAVWESGVEPDVARGQSLAAALLIPISPSSILKLTELVCPSRTAQGNTR